jgi:hypothetical protein
MDDDGWRSSPWKIDRKKKAFKILERYLIPHRSTPEKVYLDRLRVVSTAWGGIFFHRIYLPDAPILHDHPWNFWSLILKGGGYVEVRPHGVRRRVKRFNRVRATDAHYIESLASPEVWTLLFIGRRSRNWGYLRPTETGFEWTAWDKDENHKTGEVQR